MTIGSAHADDLPGIVGMEECFAGSRWSEGAWAEEFASARGHVLVARDAEEAVVGVAAFSHVAGVADLNRVVVHVVHRRRGLGRRLVLAGLAWAGSLGAHQVMLEVDAGNGAAIGLYQGLGFVALARRENYYGAGRDALVMALPLTGE